MQSWLESTRDPFTALPDAIRARRADIQDVYPLSPVQEGILFHLLIAPENDPYRIQNRIGFSSRHELERFAEALNKVIARHDVLRTSVVWEGVADPLQIVWRDAALEIEEIALDPADGSVAEQLEQLVDTPPYALDLSRAPSMRLAASFDPVARQWTAIWRSHHLFSDYATDAMIKAEIGTLLRDEDASLPPAAPFRAYVETARQESDSADSSAFFSGMLGKVTEVTAPFGLDDIREGRAHVHDARLQLDPDLVRRAKEAARLAGVGSSRLFHVAWALVVSRCSGQADPVFGTVLSSRARGAFAQTAGPLINTLPIRVQLGDATVEHCCRAVDGLLQGLVRHRHTSLVAAQRASGVPAPAPLFTAAFNYVRMQGVDLTSGDDADRRDGLTFQQDYPLTHYPFMLSVEDFGETIGLTAQVDPEVDPERVCAMVVRAVAGLTDAVIGRTGQPVGAIDVLPDDERRQLLEGWNATARDYPAGLCVHQLFQRQAAAHPERLAVTDGTVELTYRELNTRANRLAWRLIEWGVGADTRVAICMRRSASMLVALMGVLKAGGAYVPIDPAYPDERQALILRDSRPTLVLTDDATQAMAEAAAALADSAAPVFSLDVLKAIDSRSNDPGIGDDAQLCFVIYTSGSTGRPKGVMIEHRNLVNLLHWAMEEFTPQERAAIVASTSLCFDLHAFECFVPLASGGTVVVAENGLCLETVKGEALLNTVPSVLRELIETGTLPVAIDPVNVAGEKLAGSIVEAAFANTTVSRLRNLYGPSETTVYSTFAAMDRATGFVSHIGRPVANTRIYILDAMANPTPIGIPGELYIGGAGVSRGYLEQPELTEQRFVASPFVAGDRLYRTGDVARYLPDGSIEYIGRNDFQVKIRGFRIELGEIEEQVRACPGVDDAVVIAHEVRPGDPRLIAFFAAPALAGDMDAPTVERVRGRLEAALPTHLVPSHFVRLDRLPRTPNGKLDRAALPLPDFTQTHGTTADRPMGPMEETILSIWSTVLDIDAIGRHDNFFELGGHSLHAMRVIANLRSAFKRRFTIHDMFAFPTISQFAERVQSVDAQEEETI